MTEVGLGVSTQLVAKEIKEITTGSTVTGVKDGTGIGTTVDNTTEREKLTADAFVGSSDGDVTEEKINTAWKNAVTAHNDVIPDAKTIKIGGVGSNGEQQQFALGGATMVDAQVGDQNVDTLSTNEQRSALTDAVNTEATSLKELANENLSQLNDVTENTKGIKLLDNTEGDLANLDTQRAAMHKRQEEIRKALTDNTSVLNPEQKKQLEAEQETLNGAMDTIDNVPKTFQTQNGANIKITSGSNIVSIDKSSIDSTESLEGYEGFFGSGENAPTAAQAYEAFETQMKAATGQDEDFALGDNQNIVMYRDGEEVKFLLVESAMTDDNNRETVISKPITASRKDDGTTTIDTDNIASTKDDQSGAVTDASIGGYKFTNNDDQAGNSNGSGGKAVTISLVEDSVVNESWLKNISVASEAAAEEARPTGIPEEAIKVQEENILGVPVYMETKDVAVYSGAPQRGTRSEDYYSFTLTKTQLEELKNNQYLGSGDNGWLQDGLELTDNNSSTGRRDIITKNTDGTYTLKVSKETLDRLQDKILIEQQIEDRDWTGRQAGSTQLAN